MSREKKAPLIFISHSSRNKTQVQLLANLLTSIRLMPRQQVFCSSLPGFDIPIIYNDRIFDFLRDSYTEYDIHVFFIHSHEYYESAICLNEMGAAWALKSVYTSFLLPGFMFSEMKGVINGDRIAIKLDNDTSEVRDKLNQLRKQLTKEFNLEPISDILWEQSRDKFIEEIRDLATKTAVSPKNSTEKSKGEHVELSGLGIAFSELLSDLYDISVSFRESIRYEDEFQVSREYQLLQNQVQKIYYFSEKNRFNDKELSQKGIDIVALFNDYFQRCEANKRIYSDEVRYKTFYRDIKHLETAVEGVLLTLSKI